MIRGLFIFLPCLLAPLVFADTIYKTVDEEGNINYSAEPPPEGQDFEVLDSAPEPDEAGVRAAEERQKKLEEYLDDTAGPETQPQQPESDAASNKTDSSAVVADWRERKNEERRRSFWGENWPVHHPRHR